MVASDRNEGLRWNELRTLERRVLTWTPWALPSRVAVCLTVGIAVSGCAVGDDDQMGGRGLSEFAEDVLLEGRAVENITACVVDAVCYLRIEFADTTLNALYGTGERPAPPCEISREVSDVAFEVEPGDLISVRISTCDVGRYYMAQLVRQ